MTDDQFPMISFCPECNDRRGATHARNYLIEGLKKGTVRVYGPQCGHFWDLPATEMASLSKVLLPDGEEVRADAHN